MTEPVVTLTNAGLRYGDKRVLQDLNFFMNPGNIVTVIGPNGAGKTSLIKLLLGIESPTEGQVECRPATRIGYVPQNMMLQPTLPMTVARFLKLADSTRTGSARALEQTGVTHLRDVSVHHLSGGEFQRVLMARAILRNPDLLVLDEPAQGLDVQGQTVLYQLIRDIRDELNCAVLTVSHDLHLVMASTDTVLCLNGHICCRGHPEQISQDPAFVNLFGEGLARTLAVYQHHHDHSHDLHGGTLQPDTETEIP